MGVTFSS